MLPSLLLDGLQDGPGEAQERPKTGPRAPKSAPRAAQEGTKRRLFGPQRGDTNKCHTLFGSMASRMAPIDLPDPPEEPQEDPNSAPREPKESPKRTPREPQESPSRLPPPSLPPPPSRPPPTPPTRRRYKEVGGRRNRRRYARVGGSTPENHDSRYASQKLLFWDGLVGIREA